MINMKSTPLELTPERRGNSLHTALRMQNWRPRAKTSIFYTPIFGLFFKCDTVVHFEGSDGVENSGISIFPRENARDHFPRKSQNHRFVSHRFIYTKRKSRGPGPSRTHAGAPKDEISTALRSDPTPPFSKSCVFTRWFSGRFRDCDTVDHFEQAHLVRQDQEEEEVYIQE